MIIAKYYTDLVKKKYIGSILYIDKFVDLLAVADNIILHV